jgi:hypothetical protein
MNGQFDQVANIHRSGLILIGAVTAVVERTIDIHPFATQQGQIDQIDAAIVIRIARIGYDCGAL